MNIKRVIITRLNQEERIGGRWNNPIWICSRFNLMLRTTARSLEKQTTKLPFEWLVLGHPETADLLDSFAADLPSYAHICYDYDDYRRRIVETEEPDLIQEVRIDCDDAIYSYALGAMFNQDHSKYEVVYLKDGFVFNAQTGEVARSVFRNNTSAAFLLYNFPPLSWAFHRDDWFLDRGGSDHTVAARWDKSIGLEGFPYLITYTGDNVSDQWTNHAGEIIEGEERDRTYREFALCEIYGLVNGTNRHI